MKNQLNDKDLIFLKPQNLPPSSSVSPNCDIVAFTIFGKHDTLLDVFGYLSEYGFPAILDRELDDDYVEPAEDSKDALAYVDYSGKKAIYYVKKNVSGFLANPNNQMGDYASHAKSLGKETYEYFIVNKECFLCYLKFLKTKNVAHLRNAEKQL